MDIATILGIVGGAVMIVMSVMTSGGTMGGILDLPSAAMTIGGSYFAMFIASPLKKALGLFKIMGRAFKVPDFGEKNIVVKVGHIIKSVIKKAIPLTTEVGGTCCSESARLIKSRTIEKRRKQVTRMSRLGARVRTVSKSKSLTEKATSLPD